MDLSPFERSIILELLSGDVDEASLHEQLESCSVSERDVSGHGIFVRLLVAGEVARLARASELPIEGSPRPFLVHPDVEHGATALLTKPLSLRTVVLFLVVGFLLDRVVRYIGRLI